MLDLGANVIVSGSNLFQFALMGFCYYSILNKNTKPKIGILNIGTENNKGLVDLGVFRNETKISRNISIELLEFFDKKLFTLRSDNGRIVKSDPSNIFK